VFSCSLYLLLNKGEEIKVDKSRQCRPLSTLTIKK
jgi:hypothetical protein